MDAQPTNIEPERRTRLQSVSDGELRDLRSDMLEAENRIAEDVDKIKEILTPESVANQLVSAVKGELLLRIKAIDTQRFRAAGNKIRSSIKEHPYLSTFLGLGLVSGIVAYGVLKNKGTGLIDTIKQKGERVIGAPSEFGEQNYGPPLGEAYMEVVTVSPVENFESGDIDLESPGFEKKEPEAGFDAADNQGKTR